MMHLKYILSRYEYDYIIIIHLDKNKNNWTLQGRKNPCKMAWNDKKSIQSRPRTFLWLLIYPNCQVPQTPSNLAARALVNHQIGDTFYDSRIKQYTCIILRNHYDLIFW